MRALPAFVALLSVACGATLPHPPYVAQPKSAFVAIPFPPPPARVDAVPDLPRADAVWVDGEWVWRRKRWAWRPGRWVVAPAGASYSPSTFVRGPDGTLFVAPGIWRGEGGAVIATPTALAIAKDAAGSVVDSEGELESAGANIKR